MTLGKVMVYAFGKPSRKIERFLKVELASLLEMRGESSFGWTNSVATPC